MQRIRKKQQRIGQNWILSRGHRRLAPAVRRSAKIDPSVRDFAKRLRGCSNSIAITRGLRRKRRTLRTRLPDLELHRDHAGPAPETEDPSDAPACTADRIEAPKARPHTSPPPSLLTAEHRNSIPHRA